MNEPKKDWAWIETCHSMSLRYMRWANQADEDGEHGVARWFWKEWNMWCDRFGIAVWGKGHEK